MLSTDITIICDNVHVSGMVGPMLGTLLCDVWPN